MDQDVILSKLQERFRKATERRKDASARFSEALQLPSDIVYPDSTDRMHPASSEYIAAVREVVRAASALTNFLTHGTIAPEDEADSERET